MRIFELLLIMIITGCQFTKKLPIEPERYVLLTCCQGADVVSKHGVYAVRGMRVLDRKMQDHPEEVKIDIESFQITVHRADNIVFKEQNQTAYFSEKFMKFINREIAVGDSIRFDNIKVSGGNKQIQGLSLAYTHKEKWKRDLPYHPGVYDLDKDMIVEPD